MTTFTLKIYRRTRPQETVGLLEERIPLEATEEMEARIEARLRFASLNWESHFAALESNDGQFVTFWASKHA